jgi:hypothetical protein
MEFILSIDTEGDNQWNHGRELTVENIRFIPRFQDLCNKYFVKPTYLVTTEICEDPFAIEIFSDYIRSDKAEIGAHLHSWTTPPFKDIDGYRFNDPIHSFATELPEEFLNSKIRNLTLQIENSFGKRPFSFRSGRFGFDKTVARLLASNSYLVDSSVTPFTDWRTHAGMPGGKGGSDFLTKDSQPYRYHFNEKTLLEIPVTILPTKFPLNSNKAIAEYFFKNVENNILLRGTRRLLFQRQPLWMRPFEWMNITLFEQVINEALKKEVPYLVMMFHSSELMPGCSKYRKDTESIEKLYVILEELFILLANKNIISSMLTEAAKNSKI